MHNLGDLVARLKLNVIKLTLFPLDDGYELTMDVNGQMETMFFSYQESQVLELIDQGIVPTVLLSGICQSTVRYLYNDYVILEVSDRRDSSSVAVAGELCVLRVSECGIYKLTAVDVHRGEVAEERAILAARGSSRLLLSPADTIDNTEDAFGFMRSDWFSGQLEQRRLRRARRRQLRRSLHGDEMSLGDLKTSVRDFLGRSGLSAGSIDPWNSTERTQVFTGTVEPATIAQSFRIKPTVKRKQPSNDYVEESIEEIRVESQSNAVSQLKVYRREPDGQHFGCLCILNWEGGDSCPVRFPLGREVSMGRFLRQFVDAQTTRATSVFIRTREMAAKAKQQQLASAAAAVSTSVADQQQQKQSTVTMTTTTAGSEVPLLPLATVSSSVQQVAAAPGQIASSSSSSSLPPNQAHHHHPQQQPQQLQRGLSAYQLALQQAAVRRHQAASQSGQTTASAVLLANQMMQTTQNQQQQQYTRWPSGPSSALTPGNTPTVSNPITTVKRVV